MKNSMDHDVYQICKLKLCQNVESQRVHLFKYTNHIFHIHHEVLYKTAGPITAGKISHKLAFTQFVR